MDNKVTAAEDARARRIAYGLPARRAITEAAGFRTPAGARLAIGLERGLLHRSAVLSALVKKERELTDRRER